MAKSPTPGTIEEKKSAVRIPPSLFPSFALVSPHLNPHISNLQRPQVARFKALRKEIKARDFPDSPAKGFPSKCNMSAKKELASEVGAQLASYASRQTLPRKSKLGW